MNLFSSGKIGASREEVVTEPGEPAMGFRREDKNKNTESTNMGKVDLRPTRRDTARLDNRMEELDRLEREAKQERKEVCELIRAGDSFNDEKSFKKISDSQIRHSMRPARIEAVEEQIEQALKALGISLSTARNEWNACVSAKERESFQNFMTAISPWFGGQAKESLTRREFASMHVPKIAEIRRLYVEAAFINEPDADRNRQLHLREGESFIAHVERWAGEVGLEIQ